MRYWIGLMLFACIGGARCQEDDRHSLYMRAGVYELTFGYQNKINDRWGWGLETDFRPAFKYQSKNNYEFMSWAASMWGIRIKPMLNQFVTSHTYLSYALVYRYLDANQLIYDPCSFGGSGGCDYAKYSQTNHEIGLTLFVNRKLLSHPGLEFYFGAGVQGKFVERKYSIEGVYSNQIPSDKITHPFYVTPMLYAGMKFNVAGFGRRLSDSLQK